MLLRATPVDLRRFMLKRFFYRLDSCSGGAEPPGIGDSAKRWSVRLTNVLV